MKKPLTICYFHAIIASICLLYALKAVAIDPVAPPAGVSRLHVAENAQRAASLVFEPFDSRLPTLFANQLGVGESMEDSDRLILWNVQQQAYDTYYPTRSERNETTGIEWKSDSGRKMDNTTLRPGEAFWISNVGPQITIYVPGRLPIHQRTIPLEKGENFIAYPYPESILLNQTSMGSASNSTVQARKYSDQFTDILTNEISRHFQDDSSDLSGYWLNAIGEISSQKFSIGHGYWYKHSYPETLQWTSAPSFDTSIFKEDSDGPKITHVEMDEAHQSVILTIQPNSAIKTRLSVLAQDIPDGGSFETFGDWIILDDTIYAEGTTNIQWTDHTFISEEENSSNSAARVYLIVDHEADDDADGLSDALETFVYQTSPEKADSDSDHLPDQWELEVGLTPTIDDSKLDMDGDGFTNKQEYRAGTHPTQLPASPAVLISAPSHDFVTNKKELAVHVAFSGGSFESNSFSETSSEHVHAPSPQIGLVDAIDIYVDNQHVHTWKNTNRESLGVAKCTLDIGGFEDGVYSITAYPRLSKSTLAEVPATWGQSLERFITIDRTAPNGIDVDTLSLSGAILSGDTITTENSRLRIVFPKDDSISQWVCEVKPRKPNGFSRGVWKIEDEKRVLEIKGIQFGSSTLKIISLDKAHNRTESSINLHRTKSVKSKENENES